MTDRYPLPKSAGITAVHKDIRDSVLRFQKEMHRLESELPAQITFEAGPVSPELMCIVETKQCSQMYSRAIQVFALLAVEAFLNEYGYLRLGQAVFEKKYEPLGIAKKLTNTLSEVLGSFDETSEIVAVVRKLGERRNRLVHPRPELTALTEGGATVQTAGRVPSADPGSAEAAVQEIERFFELFVKLDPEAAAILGH